MTKTSDCDLLIVGGGPAGLSAAINAASEGLRVCLVDSGMKLGGQARESAAIENYAGFPEGVTGDSLMTRMTDQAAQRFNATIYAPVTAAELHVDGDRRVLVTDDYQEICARAVLLGVGMSYRRHDAKGLGPLMGRGIYYSSVPSCLDSAVDVTVAIVGMANSAGQAAERLLANPRIKVRLYGRRNMADQMSTYLVERIRRKAEQLDDAELINENCNVTEVHGTRKLESITVLRDDGTKYEAMTDYLLFYIGGTPQTFWLKQDVHLDDKKFVVTGPDLGKKWPAKVMKRQPFPWETSLAGVFAAGDVQRGSAKRIAAAVGAGSSAVATVHQYFRLLEESR